MSKPQEASQPEAQHTSYARRFSTSLAAKSADFSKIMDYFERHAANLTLVKCLSQKCNVSPGVVLLVLIVVVTVFLVSRLGGSIICDAVGFLYPSYKSYKVLKLLEPPAKSKPAEPSPAEPKSGDPTPAASASRAPPEADRALENRKQLVYWTKYWVVFSLGFLFNYFANMFLYWVPFYYVMKLAFIVLLLHPRLQVGRAHAQGAEVIYNYLIAPLLNKYEAAIDNAVVSLESTADQLITKYGVEKLSGRLRDYATKQAVAEPAPNV